ncbi:prepilin peptidase [Jeotgalibacillus soli]|uniref:Prepilin peptidase n=2 Tax=Jeotgalibacillus soli TaxID=889306 RepID=A0A0C2VJA5_9BACL|nr:prepilin peptidase [Jeotgalibacillus soli]
MGSFYNVVGLRVPKKESIVHPGSHCASCQHELKWFELIPVVSYIILKGKCRKCGQGVSLIYPVIEMLTGLLFAFSFYLLGFSLEFLVALVFISLLIIIVVSDIAYMLIPDSILILFGSILLLLRIIEPLSPWWDSFAGAAAGFCLLLLIAVVSKGGMGGGDIKLYAVVGLVLGVKLTLLSFFIAALLGSIVGMTAISMKIRKRKEPIPFGPFIAAASVITYFFGAELINGYVNWLLY